MTVRLMKAVGARESTNGNLTKSLPEKITSTVLRNAARPNTRNRADMMTIVNRVADLPRTMATGTETNVPRREARNEAETEIDAARKEDAILGVVPVVKSQKAAIVAIPRPEAVLQTMLTMLLLENAKTIIDKTRFQKVVLPIYSKFVLTWVEVEL
jgi:hypothetical protein